MMLALLLLLAVRPEPVEGRRDGREVGRPSTSSGRTEGGDARRADRESRTVIEAERAFAEDAQRLGQWTAFRKWAATDATMFVPQPVRAQEWLKDRADPAKAIEWWPTAAWVSCDGSLAVDTGGWRRPNGSVGTFTTVWSRQRNGRWQWLMDKGDELTRPIAPVAVPHVVKASCQGRAVIDIGGFVGVQLYRSRDQTLFGGWDEQSGASSFFVDRWEGHHYVRLESADIAPTP